MTLAQYLQKHDIRPSVFAAEVGVAASTITRLLKGERSPGIKLIALISEKTSGEVGANDFLPAIPHVEAAE